MAGAYLSPRSRPRGRSLSSRFRPSCWELIERRTPRWSRRTSNWRNAWLWRIPLGAKAGLQRFLDDVVPARVHVSEAVWARHYYGFSGKQAQGVFSTGLMIFSLVMIFAGRWQDRVGPRAVALAGGWVVAAGYLLAGR